MTADPVSATVETLTAALTASGLDSEVADGLAQGMVKLAMDSAKAQGVPPGTAEISDDALELLLNSVLSTGDGKGQTFR